MRTVLIIGLIFIGKAIMKSHGVTEHMTDGQATFLALLIVTCMFTDVAEFIKNLMK